MAVRRRTLTVAIVCLALSGLGWTLHELPSAAPRTASAVASAPAAPRAKGLAVVSALALPANPRVIVFAPHPDDETLGVGGLIFRLAQARTPLEVVFVTNGDGYPDAVQEDFDVTHPTDADYVAFGELRQREAVAALA